MRPDFGELHLLHPSPRRAPALITRAAAGRGPP